MTSGRNSRSCAFQKCTIIEDIRKSSLPLDKGSGCFFLSLLHNHQLWIVLIHSVLKCCTLDRRYKVSKLLNYQYYIRYRVEGRRVKSWKITIDVDYESLEDAKMNRERMIPIN